jgi:uncharacterized delta-60 repeat protein
MADPTTPNTAPTLTIKDGWVTTGFGDNRDEWPAKVAVQPDGKILMTTISNGLVALARYNTDGSLDTSFSGDGKLTADLGSSLNGADFKLQGDGTIVVYRHTYSGLTVTHFTPNGDLDTHFGTNGTLTSASSFRYANIFSMGVLGDGKIVTAGSGYTTDTDYVVRRYNADGTFDTNFGTNGTATVNVGKRDLLHEMMLQPDGKILFVGESTDWPSPVYSLVRLNANGSPDTSFSGDGIVTVSTGTDYNYMPDAMALQADGKIVVGAWNTLQDTAGFKLLRYATDGSLDPSFHGTGSVTFKADWFRGADLEAISIQKDGKILALGNAHDASQTAYTFIARFLSDGTIDETFGNKGVAQAAQPGSARTTGLLVQADGKIVVDGIVSVGSGDNDFMAMRFNADGSVDQTFSPGQNLQTGTPTFLEGTAASFGKPVVLNNAIQVHDAELAATGYNGASLTLMRHDGANADDAFYVKYGDRFAALYSGNDYSVGGVTIGRVTASGAGKLTLTFNTNATEALVNKGLQQIAYGNNSNTPPEKVLIDWLFSDGNSGAQGTGGTLTALGSTAVSIIATNDIPTGHRVPDQKAADGVAYSYVIPANTFVDPDHDTLTYSVVMWDGRPLPSWLKFDPATNTLSGTPVTSDIGTVNLRAMARDGNGAAPSTYFSLYVIPKPMHVDGTAGADNLVGAENGDVLQGFGGNDTLNGKAGADTLIGGDGNDSYYVDNVGDVVTEAANGGTDTVYSTLASYRLAPNVEYARTQSEIRSDLIGNELGNVLYAGNGDNVLDGGLGNDTASYAYATDEVAVSLAVTTSQYTGYSGFDTLLNIENLAGSRYNDSLTGNQQNNTLNGGAGADTMTGGDGSDIYYVDNAGDVVRETNGDPVKGGIDTINASVSYKLAGYVENLTLTGTDAINATGNSLANKLVGNSGNNILDGGAGTDTMSGGLGNDSYYVDNAGDVVSEAPGAGTDTVVSTVTRTLGDNQENLTLAGTAAINGTGNSLDNTITGNAARNVLNGGTGADKLIGGLGDDFYYVDNVGDTVIESSDATSGGTDTVTATITYTLGTYIENLTLSGTTAVNGTGNALANKIIGNGAANTLSGGDGADTLSGGLGNDTLTGGQGKDALEGGSGSDVFVFNAASETGTTSATRDVITDFVRGQDKIDLRGIDANTATTANDAFTTFIAGTAVFTAAGQLKFVDGVLYGNTDGDADAEFAIQLTGITQLTTADVML